MHPGIRIICFLVFVTCLSRANAGQLLLGLGFVCLLYFFSSTRFIQQAFSMLLRLRWFFLSILILYFWMMPDTSLSTDSATIFSFISPGISAGLERIFSLILVVLAVSYLLASLEQKQLLAAIYWLTTPFVYLGLEREKMALRLAMGLQAVGELVNAPRHNLAHENTMDKSKIFSYRFYRHLYQNITKSLQHYYQYTLACAEKDVNKEVTFDSLNRPAFWQWGYPAGLYATFVLADIFST